MYDILMKLDIRKINLTWAVGKSSHHLTYELNFATLPWEGQKVLFQRYSAVIQ